ncbi:MAG: metal-sensing transcriptional repressor [Coriobacteriales bacterium]|jgi:DNA-binding FrmR family transcriptional regulator
MARNDMKDETAGKAVACNHDGSGGVSSCSECRYKKTARSDELQADLQKRLNRAIGQLGGVKQMIEDGRYCGDVLTQLAAVESAVRRISDLVLQDHLETCVLEQVRDGNDEVVDELMDLLRKFRR